MSQRKRKATNTRQSGNTNKGKARSGKRTSKEKFGDFMDLAEDQQASSPSKPGTRTPDPSGEKKDQSTPVEAATATKPWHQESENRTPAWAWGMLPAACTLIVGSALGSALVFLFNGDPHKMWDFSGLSNLSSIYDLNQYPQHVFFAVIASAVLLLGMVGYRMGTIISDLKSRVLTQDELLGHLTSLRLENPAGWTNPIFKMNPTLESFTTEIQAAWRKNESRLQRVVGLEGELHRLEKALSEGSREDLGGKFEIPAVGLIADEVSQMYDAREKAEEELNSWQAKLGSKGHEVMGEMQDACGWQRFTLDQLNLQEEAVKRASIHLAEASSQMAQDPRYQWDPADIMGLLTDIQTYLAGNHRKTNSGSGSNSGAEAPDLLDRLTKLSFQIGMEVARLGGRGERLGPMTQTLEELTQALRKASTSGTVSKVASPAASGEILGRLDEQLAKFKAVVVRPNREVVQLVQKLSQATEDTASNLGKIAGSFDSQYDRLGKIGQISSDLTGVDFEVTPAATGMNQDLQLSQVDPFLKREPEKDVEIIDPFMENEDSCTVQGNSLDPLEVSNNILPGSEDVFARSGDPILESNLSEPQGKVYDLAEFGAVKITGNPQPGSAEEIVHELAEFGAVLISGAQQRAVGDDRVYDLDEFGARRLD